jgi:hypothetical protein
MKKLKSKNSKFKSVQNYLRPFLTFDFFGSRCWCEGLLLRLAHQQPRARLLLVRLRCKLSFDTNNGGLVLGRLSFERF